jgi:hypothetical protein
MLAASAGVAPPSTFTSNSWDVSSSSSDALQVAAMLSSTHGRGCIHCMLPQWASKMPVTEAAYYVAGLQRLQQPSVRHSVYP